MTRTKQEKSIFTLRDIDNTRIDQRFGLEYVKPNITLIEKLEPVKQEMVNFLDDSKKLIKCQVSLVDLDSKNQYNCFWCRHPTIPGTRPIGCPIRFITHEAVKTYKSEISKDDYTIRENITDSMMEKILSHQRGDVLSVVKNGYYITDGIFCSFSCCMAFILDNKTIHMYKDSQRLLLKMYRDLCESNLDEIEPSHHWRTLSVYGGSLSIEKYRSTLGKTEYINHGTVIRNAKIGVLFEQKLRF